MFVKEKPATGMQVVGKNLGSEQVKEFATKCVVWLADKPPLKTSLLHDFISTKLPKNETNLENFDYRTFISNYREIFQCDSFCYPRSHIYEPIPVKMSKCNF